MSRWICTDCSWQPKPGRRIHCALCTGFTYLEAARKKHATHLLDVRRQRTLRLKDAA